MFLDASRDGIVLVGTSPGYRSVSTLSLCFVPREWTWPPRMSQEPLPYGRQILRVYGCGPLVFGRTFIGAGVSDERGD